MRCIGNNTTLAMPCVCIYIYTHIFLIIIVVIVSVVVIIVIVGFVFWKCFLNNKIPHIYMYIDLFTS